MSFDKAPAPFSGDRRVIATVVACEDLICDLFHATVAKSRDLIEMLSLLLLGEPFTGGIVSASQRVTII